MGILEHFDPAACSRFSETVLHQTVDAARIVSHTLEQDEHHARMAFLPRSRETYAIEIEDGSLLVIVVLRLRSRSDQLEESHSDGSRGTRATTLPL